MEKEKRPGEKEETKGNIIRLLRSDEIECRVATASEKGVSLLLYKDARVDQKILDETFGPFGWKRSHQCVDGNLYCTVEVRDRETGEWVAKQDVGTMGYTEKEKSQASDSFKRACFNWGIGRELYTAPFIWLPAGKVTVQKQGDRYVCRDSFSVVSIEYNKEREITALKILKNREQPVYEWRAAGNKTAENQAAGNPLSDDKGGKSPKREVAGRESLTEAQLLELQTELDRTGISMETVKERYRFAEPANMGEELYKRVMKALEKTKTVKAA